MIAVCAKYRLPGRCRNKMLYILCRDLCLPERLSSPQTYLVASVLLLEARANAFSQAEWASGVWSCTTHRRLEPRRFRHVDRAQRRPTVVRVGWAGSMRSSSAAEVCCNNFSCSLPLPGALPRRSVFGKLCDRLRSSVSSPFVSKGWPQASLDDHHFLHSAFMWRDGATS